MNNPLQFLKNHPFAVEAFFESSTVLTFAAPKEQLQGLIPPCLQLDTFQDKYGFIAVAMVQTKNLRPKGFPKFMGSNFFLIGYRIFTKYHNNAGKRLRGLYILKSETDQKKMEYLGSIFTQYKYATTDIQQIITPEKNQIIYSKSGFKVEVVKDKQETSLPSKSPFADWKEARRFAGPLPFTFTYQPKNQSVLIIEGVRQNWKPTPIEVGQYHIPFLDELQIENLTLANAFIIKNIPYHWKKGKIEQWKPIENPFKE
ncbi:MAG: DUF2071 domain-containing protein [Chitinophagales bacterium]